MFEQPNGQWPHTHIFSIVSLNCSQPNELTEQIHPIHNTVGHLALCLMRKGCYVKLYTKEINIVYCFFFLVFWLLSSVYLSVCFENESLELDFRSGDWLPDLLKRNSSPPTQKKNAAIQDAGDFWHFKKTEILALYKSLPFQTFPTLPICLYVFIYFSLSSLHLLLKRLKQWFGIN